MEERIIDIKIKEAIFQSLSSREDFLGNLGEFDGIIVFLCRIWPLESLPSQDRRYSNAYEEARANLVLEKRWSLNYTFLERFALLDGSNEHFSLFLEVLVGPGVRKSKEEILLYVKLINNFIFKSDLKLAVWDYFDEMPIFRLRPLLSIGEKPIEMRENEIPFFKKLTDVDQYPCFVLSYDNWNEFSIHTLMRLHYWPAPMERSNEIFIKIMKRHSLKTWNELEEKFWKLGEDFCSCGIDESYYKNIKEMLPNSYYSVLYALRDCGLFSRTADLFKEDYIYNASFRYYNFNERMLRTIRFDLCGLGYSHTFKFNFVYSHKRGLEGYINFDFQLNGAIRNRVYGLRSKNGGTTRLPEIIFESLRNDKSGLIAVKPVYGKVFFITDDLQDGHHSGDAAGSFNFISYGIKRLTGSWFEQSSLKKQFYGSALQIYEKDETENWKILLEVFIGHEEVSKIFERNYRDNWRFLPENFPEFYDNRTEEQRILLFITTEIAAQIRYNSLLIIDQILVFTDHHKLEVMKLLYETITRYSSFCIIGADSDLVCRRLLEEGINILDYEF